MENGFYLVERQCPWELLTMFQININLESKKAEVNIVVEQTKPEKKTVPEDISASKQPDIGVGTGKVQQKEQTFSGDIVATKKAERKPKRILE